MIEKKFKKIQVSAILLASGKGTRFKAEIPKQFVLLEGVELIGWSFLRLNEISTISELIIGCEKQYQSRIMEICKRISPQLLPLIKFALPGNTRQQSVYNAVKQCSRESILLHESARPHASNTLFRRILNHPNENVTSALEIPFTVLKKENNKICGILKRDELFNVQLPQKFNRKALLSAHQQAAADQKEFTDDSSLLFYYGFEVATTEGEVENIKITHPSDIRN